MLFSSPQFLFAFLPAVIVGAAAAAKLGGKAMAFVWLIAASLFFYAWWNPPYLLLLCASVVGNYLFGRELTRTHSRGLLFVGVTFNLGLIAYFKYAQFLLDAVNDLSGTGFRSGDIVLPLAISFFTFQQIAYLVDVYQGRVRDTDFVHYCLFVTFFPQLIAGPIVHHSEVIPQFLRGAVLRISGANLLAGLTIFVIGLYKKVVIADGVAIYATSVFSATGAPTFFEAWGGALAYTFQIYFDFSGYSDMAIGLARVFGVALPINFDSPYKAVSIIDFWRRWHMTLSRFLKDYLYTPLGGSRQGRPRRYVNVIITMLLGGLWHGAAWTFVFWGGLHGGYLVINQAWRALCARLGRDPARSSPLERGLSRLLTFLAVVVGWVFFRAETWERAMTMLEGMAGLHGFVLTPRLFDSLGDMGPMLVELGLVAGRTPSLDLTIFPWLGILIVIVWFAPNSQKLTEGFESAFAFKPRTPVPTGGGAKTLAWDNRWLLLVPFTFGAAVLCAMIAVYRGGDMAPFVYMVF